MAWENMLNFYGLLPEDCTAPRIRLITNPKQIAKYGGPRMLVVPSSAYASIMKEIPLGKLTTVVEIRDLFAKHNNADFTDPITAGKFCAAMAWASVQRAQDKVPYWRVLKSGGELNSNYPGGVAAQKALLEQEGHQVISLTGFDSRYYVKFYEKALFSLNRIKPKEIYTFDVKEDLAISK